MYDLSINEHFFHPYLKNPHRILDMGHQVFSTHFHGLIPCNTYVFTLCP